VACLNFLGEPLQALAFVAGGVELELRSNQLLVLLLQGGGEKKVGQAKERQGAQDEDEGIPGGQTEADGLALSAKTP
jgi:hypothetical protein